MERQTYGFIWKMGKKLGGGWTWEIRSGYDLSDSDLCLNQGYAKSHAEAEVEITKRGAKLWN